MTGKRRNEPRAELGRIYWVSLITAMFGGAHVASAELLAHWSLDEVSGETAKDVSGNERAEARLTNALAGVTRGSKLASQLLHELALFSTY